MSTNVSTITKKIEIRQPEHAITAYIEAGCYDDAARVIERVVYDFYGKGALDTILLWRRQIGSEALYKLAFTCAMIHSRRLQYDDALRELDYAETKLPPDNGPASRELMNVVADRAHIHTATGDYEQTLLDIQPYLDEKTAYSQARIHRIQGIVALRRGDLDDAIDHLEQASQYCEADQTQLGLTQILQDLYVAYLRVGKLKEAGSAINRVVNILRNRDEAALAWALNNLAYFYHVMFNFDEAHTILKDALQLTEKLAEKRAQVNILFSMANLYRDAGEYEVAEVHYDKALAMISDEPFMQARILIRKATMYRWQTQLKKALQLAQEAYLLAGDSITERAMALAEMGLARVLLNHPNGDTMIMEAIELLTTHNNVLDKGRALTMLAEAQLVSDEPIKAAMTFKQVVKLCRESAIYQPEIVEVARSPIAVQALVAEYDDMAARLSEFHQQITKVSDTPATYRLMAFKDHAEVNGLLLTTTDWRSLTAWHLVVFLAVNGPATLEEIGLAFWPDKPYETMRHNVHTMLRLARQALNDKSAILCEDRTYQLNPVNAVWLDFKHFEDAVTRAANLPCWEPRAADLYDVAIDLYGGAFLKSCQNDWAAELRTHYEELYIKALVGAGRCAHDRADWEAAAAYFERALKIDPYREPVHQFFLKTLIESGDYIRAVYHYGQLEERLLDELGVMPAPETRELVPTAVIRE